MRLEQEDLLRAPPRPRWASPSAPRPPATRRPADLRARPPGHYTPFHPSGMMRPRSAAVGMEWVSPEDILRRLAGADDRPPTLRVLDDRTAALARLAALV